MSRSGLRLAAGCVLLFSFHPLAASRPSDTDTYEAAVREAGVSFGAGDTNASLTHIERALEARPDGVGALALLSQIHLSLRHPQEAAAVLEHLVGIVGSDTPLGLDALTLGGYALGLAERYDEARHKLESVLAAAPRRPMTNLLLARIHLQLGQCRLAVERFRGELAIPADRPAQSRLVARWSPASALEGLGLAAYQCGDILLAKQSLAEVPDAALSHEGRHHMGLMLAHEGRHRDAVRAFEKVLAASPAHRGALLGMMRAAAAAGIEPMERDAAAKLAAIDSEDRNRRAARVRAGDLQTAALRSLAAGDRAAAAAALEEAAALTEDPSALTSIARHQHEAGDSAGAEATIHRVLARAPFDADGHASLGIIRHDRGDFAAAADSFERAARLVPTDMAFRIRLAGTYLAMGRPGDALEQLRKARDLDDAVTPRADLTGLAAAGEDVIDDAIEAARYDARLGRGTGPEFEQILREIHQDHRRKRGAATLS